MTRYIWQHLRNYKGWITLSAILLLLQSLLVVLFPIPVKFLFDHVFTNTDHAQVTIPLLDFEVNAAQALGVILALIFVLAVLRVIVDYLEELALSKSSAYLVQSVKERFFSLLMSRQHQFYNQHRAVDVLSRVTGDSTNLEIFITSGLTVVLRAAPTILFILGTMFLLDWRFSSMVVLILPAMYFITTYFSQRVREWTKKYRRSFASLDMDIHQTLSSISLVKSLTMETAIEKQLTKKNRKVTESLIESRRYYGLLKSSLNGTKSFIWIAAIGIGGFGIFNNWVTLGTVVLFIAYIEAIGKPINEIAKFAAKYSKAVVSYERIQSLESKLLDYPETSGQKTLAIPPNRPFSYEFKNVSFGYTDSRLILDNFSATFHNGDWVAVVGPSGAGKSTFTKILNRLLDPISGQLCISGEDIKNYKLNSLRKLVTVISQETLFLHGSVKENIGLAMNQIEKDGLNKALEVTNSKLFVSQLAQQEETIIGEGGTPLSGGQQKRLSMARAFVRSDSRIFIFDEPTSGLDPFSMQKIVKAMKNLSKQGHLVFWITHNFDMLEDTDKVVYFRPNSNPLVGDHKKMIRKDSNYENFIIGELS